tara:strand:- start:36 stop:404 length:369 start_codon:yes stop_codon:yes gene_type:complete
MLPEKNMVLDEKGECFDSVLLFEELPSFLFLIVKKTVFVIWVTKIRRRRASSTRTSGLIFSRLETKKLKLSAPVKIIRLFAKWNKRKKQKRRPLIATIIFLPRVEPIKFLTLVIDSLLLVYN